MKIQHIRTKKNLVKSTLCFMLALALCFGDFVPIFPKSGSSALAAGVSGESVQPVSAVQSSVEEIAEPEQSEGVVRPEDIDEGLSINSLEDIQGRRVTVRQPVMEILQDDIVRKHVEELPNVYQMRDMESGELLDDLAQINFASNPDLQIGNKDHPMYPMKGLDRSDKDADGKVSKQKYFSAFTKYMLLRQAYYFNTHVTDIIKKDGLKKHPAADYIYGKIPDDAKAVKMHIVTDPIYRSPITTGLYLAPGEVATVKIKGLKQGETVTLYTHHQDTLGYLGYKDDGGGFGKMEDYLKYWDQKILDEIKNAKEKGTTPDFEQFNYGLHGQWQWQNQKVPCMGTTFNIVGTGNETEVKIGSMYGGPLYVKPTSSSVDMEITGAVLTPHFVLGVTTVEEFQSQLKNAPGLIATLDVENGQLIGPAEAMRKCDDIEKLAYFWHSVFAIDISLNGRDYNYNMTMCYDMHVPAGEAVALNSNFCAQPEYWFPICMDYQRLTTKGNWGTLHELGHVQAKTHGVNWGFCDGDGEVWNNTLILLIYSMLCNMDNRVIGVEHGEFVHPYTVVERSMKITQKCTDKDTGELRDIEDYGEINDGKGEYFDQLSMYATLLHSFGPDKFVDMFYTYKVNPAYCANKRADFVYRIGIVDRVNILDWVNDNYFANISPNMFTDSQLEFLHTLPDFVPVAYRWANGIDGHETARKYDVDGKFPTVFDLSGDNIISPKKVDVISVTGVRYGKTAYDAQNQRVTYYPPDKVTEYDSFDIIVKTEGGRRVTLNVNMHLVYRGTYAEVWDLGPKDQWPGQAPSVAAAKEAVKDKKYDYTLTSPSAGVEFNHNNMEYMHLRLKYRVSESGDYYFYVKADDVAEAEFFKSDLDGEKLGKISVLHDTTDFKKYGNFKATLSVNDTVYIDCHLVNWGGKGHITVGMSRTETGDVVALPTEQIVSAGVKDSELAAVDAFKGWQPRFVDSIKNTTIDYQTSNSGWKVLVAPNSEPGCPKDNLVDGNEGTIFHSKYNGTKEKLPHVFIIDTLDDQIFNYFEFVRRTNGNDKLIKFKLYGCTEEAYNQASTDDSDTGWQELFNGSTSNVNAARQRISFSRTELRYFKFVVTDNNGGHTVIREIYAGTESKLNQTVKPRNYMTNPEDLKKTEDEGFVENSANGKLSTTKSGAIFKFEFLGNGFELYADTDYSYGKASIFVDGQDKGFINLSDKPLFNKLVFLGDELIMGVHNVVVTTVDDKPFNISFINVKYGTPVVADEKPAVGQDYGDIDVERQFTREWKTFVKDYKTLTSIQFLHDAPADYTDTYVRVDTYIRLYRKDDKIAFVYPGTILAPIECGSLFSGCEKLVDLNFDNFDTTYMRGTTSMFYGCSSLKNLDVSDFKTQNVLGFGKMFGNCTNLNSIDLGNFKLDENANLYRIFDNCVGLETINLPKEYEVQKSRSISTSDSDKIICELPYVYQDMSTGGYVTQIVLDASTAGHVLKLHNDHNFVEAAHEQVDAGCEEEGKIAYKTCAICKCNFDEPTGKVLLKDSDLVIPALGHDYRYNWPEDFNAYPTCTKAGVGGTYECNHCHDILDVTGEAPALGHMYVINTEKGENGGYTIEYGADGVATVTVYLICDTYSDWINSTKCGHETEVVLTFDYDTYQAATCEEAEFYSYDDVVDKAKLLEGILSQDKEDTVADYMPDYVSVNIKVCDTIEGHEATGHVTEKVEAVEATCLYSGNTEGTICTVCGHTEGVTATSPLGHAWESQPEVKATCTEEGHEAGEVCSRCGVLGEGVDHYKALGHDFSVNIEGEEPTCTKVGHTAGKKCSRCDAIEGHDLVDDLGHNLVVLPAKAPTETECGLTEGLYCDRCGEIITAQEEIPALGGSDVPAEEGSAPVKIIDPIIWVIIGGGAAIIAAVAAVTVVLVLKKKRKR